jgi:hypothetical protein
MKRLSKKRGMKIFSIPYSYGHTAAERYKVVDHMTRFWTWSWFQPKKQKTKKTVRILIWNLVKEVHTLSVWKLETVVHLFFGKEKPWSYISSCSYVCVQHVYIGAHRATRQLNSICLCAFKGTLSTFLNQLKILSQIGLGLNIRRQLFWILKSLYSELISAL